MKITVKQGHRYAGRIKLGMFERIASNDLIAKKFKDVGFDEVTVTGSGSERIARGRWTGEDTTADMPSQVVEVKDLSHATET